MIANQSKRIISPKESIVLVVDIQEKLFQAIKNKNELEINTVKILRSAIELGVKVFISEQNPDKLGKTINSIQEILNIKTYNKMSFSSCKCELLMKSIDNSKANSILICGIESHICVQQTALDLMDLDYEVCLPVDAIGSRNEIDHITAIRRLESEGASICTTESIIFEWCRTADRKEFKTISKIIKGG